jgi:hypothetical protein
LKTEVEEDTRTWKDFPCSLLDKINIVKNNIQIQCNPYQNSNNILHRNRKNNPRIHMGTQSTPNSQSNSQQKSSSGAVTMPDFKLYYRAMVLDTIE